TVTYPDMALRWLVAAALCFAAVAAESKEWIKNNRVPPETPVDYEYISICVNGTAENGLIPKKGKAACDDYHDQVAVGRYANKVNTTGWGILEVETMGGFPNDVQAFAAGMAEGELTRLQIYYHYRNTIEDLCIGYKKYCKDLYSYLTVHLDWLRETVEKEAPKDPYWAHVKLVFAQMTGMYESYRRKETDDQVKPGIGFDLHPIYMIQLSGELFDINKWLNKTLDPQEYPEAGKCSALLKVSKDGGVYKDMFFSHVAMSGLNTMNRVLKMYKFAYDKQAVPGRIVSFSGYAGALSSADDYTLTSGGLASIETTNAVFNETLYQLYVKPKGQVHCWVRSFISNALAHSAKEWVDIFAKYNSGTYNNQWMVVDYKKFKPGMEKLPEEDLVWILEQIPGYTETRDMTWFINAYSYFPSYNVPYLSSISLMSGFSEKAKKFDWYKWGHSPRAKIFDRDHVKVKDIDSLTKLMRYNDYTHDEYAKCKCNPPYTAEAGISARGDLNPSNGTWEVESMGFRNHAGLDYKGTNYEMFSKLRFRAWGGPPYGPLPAFDWANTRVIANHYGQPQVWNFSYVDLVWEANIEVDGITQLSSAPARDSWEDSDSADEDF
ncbi:hypothetical protein PENTCL1PPCAC_10027, partial [Pristionchus entomophagus]